MSTLINATKIALLCLSGAGFYGTWYLLINNGTMSLMEHVRDNTRILPGTKEPVLTHYTGIDYLDYRLAVLGVFFWELLDGSRPDASLFCYHFAGQIFSGWSLLILEGLRKGNRWRTISFLAIWGLVMQNLTFGVVIPIYLIIHLSTSPTVASKQVTDYLIDVPDALTVLPAMFIGYIVPAVLMSLPSPSVLSFYRKQVFIAIWQCFPLSVGILQQTFSFIISVIDNRGLNHQDRQRRSIQTMRVVYAILVVCGAINQLSTFQFGATINAFPRLFAPEFQTTWNFRSVFVPNSITPANKVDSIGSGCLLLLQYDELFGDISMCLWAFVMFMQARINTKRSLQIVRHIAIGYLVAALAGSLGFVVAAIWARDELIFAKPLKEEKEE